MSAMRSWRDVARVFRRYVLSFAVACAGVEAAILLDAHGAAAAAMFPVIAPSVVFGGYGLFGFISRMMDVDIHGWPELPPRHCKCCEEAAARIKVIAADRDELREALVTLRLPS